MKKLIQLITAMAETNRLLRSFLLSCIMRKRKIVYFFYRMKEKKIDQKLVVFESFGGRSYGGNPKALYEAMQKDFTYKGYRYVWCFRKPEEYTFLTKNRNTDVVKYRSKNYYSSYACAKYFITNYRLPQEIKKKKEQIYVQCWHGVPLKRLGYDIKSYHDRTISKRQLRKQYKRAAKDFTYLLSPSKYFTDKLTSAFNLKALHKQDIFIEKGYPRNDSLYNYSEKEREEIRKSLGIAEDKKVILYCPTYRENEYTVGVGNTMTLGIDFHRLQNALGNDYMILFRAHYLIKSQFDFSEYEGFMIDVSEYGEINELYMASDMLITDYSSVMFDYAIIEKPIILYMYDLEEYKNHLRDFYLDFSELMTDPITSEDELIKSIKETDGFGIDERYEEFNKTHNELNGPNTSEVVLAEIFQRGK